MLTLRRNDKGLIPTIQKQTHNKLGITHPITYAGNIQQILTPLNSITKFDEPELHKLHDLARNAYKNKYRVTDGLEDASEATNLSDKAIKIMHGGTHFHHPEYTNYRGEIIPTREFKTDDVRNSSGVLQIETPIVDLLKSKFNNTYLPNSNHVEMINQLDGILDYLQNKQPTTRRLIPGAITNNKLNFLQQQVNNTLQEIDAQRRSSAGYPNIYKRANYLLDSPNTNTKKTMEDLIKINHLFSNSPYKDSTLKDKIRKSLNKRQVEEHVFSEESSCPGCFNALSDSLPDNSKMGFFKPYYQGNANDFLSNRVSGLDSAKEWKRAYIPREIPPLSKLNVANLIENESKFNPYLLKMNDTTRDRFINKFGLSNLLNSMPKFLPQMEELLPPGITVNAVANSMINNNIDSEDKINFMKDLQSKGKNFSESLQELRNNQRDKEQANQWYRDQENEQKEVYDEISRNLPREELEQMAAQENLSMDIDIDEPYLTHPIVAEDFSNIPSPTIGDFLKSAGASDAIIQKVIKRVKNNKEINWRKIDEMMGKENHFAHGGYIKGSSGGQDDDVYKELNDGDYVVDATAVAALGDGNSDKGARKLEDLRKQVLGSNNHSNKDMLSMLSDSLYDDGISYTGFDTKKPIRERAGREIGREKIPAKVSHGEYILPREFVTAFGHGSNQQGAKRLDDLIYLVKSHAGFNPKANGGIMHKSGNMMDYINYMDRYLD